MEVFKAMREIPRISDAEWEVMKILWSQSPSTASQVIEALREKTNWKPKTVKTLLSRLVKKGAIGFELDKKDSRKYHYYPLISEEKQVKAESRSFLDRVYGGSLNVMIANFLEEKELSPDEIDELKAVLEKQSGLRGGHNR